MSASSRIYLTEVFKHILQAAKWSPQDQTVIQTLTQSFRHIHYPHITKQVNFKHKITAELIKKNSYLIVFLTYQLRKSKTIDETLSISK